MRQWIYRIKPARPGMLSGGPTPEEEARVGEHFRYLKELTAKGTVLLAGRTLTDGPESFGIVIFTAEGEAEARRIFEADPAVRAGVFTGEVLPFSVALTSLVRE